MLRYDGIWVIQNEDNIKYPLQTNPKYNTRIISKFMLKRKTFPFSMQARKSCSLNIIYIFSFLTLLYSKFMR